MWLHQSLFENFDAITSNTLCSRHRIAVQGRIRLQIFLAQAGGISLRSRKGRLSRWTPLRTKLWTNGNVGQTIVARTGRQPSGPYRLRQSEHVPWRQPLSTRERRNA
jgi:hypothetical protein